MKRGVAMDVYLTYYLRFSFASQYGLRSWNWKTLILSAMFFNNAKMEMTFFMWNIIMNTYTCIYAQIWICKSWCSSQYIFDIPWKVCILRVLKCFIVLFLNSFIADQVLHMFLYFSPLRYVKNFIPNYL